jgi:hypothetical protein
MTRSGDGSRLKTFGSQMSLKRKETPVDIDIKSCRSWGEDEVENVADQDIGGIGAGMRYPFSDLSSTTGTGARTFYLG